MTFDECHQTLVQIRRRQGTRFPRLRIDCGGQVFRGRLARADSDPEHRLSPVSASGALVLEDLTSGRASTTIVPLDRLRPESLRPLDDPE
jgi:hypothetical protein